MRMVRLLTAGKSLVGSKDGTVRYQMSDPRAMPKFGSAKNLFREAAKGQGGEGGGGGDPCATADRGDACATNGGGEDGAGKRDHAQPGERAATGGDSPAEGVREGSTATQKCNAAAGRDRKHGGKGEAGGFRFAGTGGKSGYPTDWQARGPSRAVVGEDQSGAKRFE